MTFALVSKERCFGTDTIVSSLNIAYSASIPSRLAPSRSVSQVVRAQRPAEPAWMEGADDPVAQLNPRYTVANGSNLAGAVGQRHYADLSWTATASFEDHQIAVVKRAGGLAF
jgi:hypothetical protein